MKRRIAFFLALICVAVTIPTHALAFTAEQVLGPKVVEYGMRDMQWPLSTGKKLTSCFYDNLTCSDGRAGHNHVHYALDMSGASAGSAVVAAYDGVVYKVLTNSDSGNSGYGNAVVLKHEYLTGAGETVTLYTKYNHLQSSCVSVNRTVKKGEKIGGVGGSGATSTTYAVHLDFQVLTSPNYGNRSTCSIDPFANELLEIPEGFTCGASSWCECCYDYVSEIQKRYAVPLMTANVASIEMKSLPDKQTFREKYDALDTSGGQITVHYLDGGTRDVPIAAGWVTGFDNTRLGQQTLTVSYGGKTCAFTVEVVEVHFYLSLDMTGISGDTDTLWVDGKPLAVTDGRVELPDDTAQTAVVYAYNDSRASRHEQYPTAMTVWMLSCPDGVYTAQRMETLDQALQYAGSSIRITGNKGIRMITSVPAAMKTNLTKKGIGGYTLVEYGTVVAWADKVTDGLTLTCQAAQKAAAYQKSKGADPVYKKLDGLVQYTNVLVGFTTQQCKDDLAMRPYMILQDASGNQLTLYGGTVYRSIGYIAYQNRNAFPEGTEAYNYIWEIIREVYPEMA